MPWQWPGLLLQPARGSPQSTRNATFLCMNRRPCLTPLTPSLPPSLTRRQRGSSDGPTRSPLPLPPSLTHSQGVKEDVLTPGSIQHGYKDNATDIGVVEEREHDGVAGAAFDVSVLAGVRAVRDEEGKN
eukprot:138014-Chlamydomonas_euryale.AAC.3